MKLATLACLAALCLVGPGAYAAAPGETAKPAVPANPAPPTGAPRPVQPAAEASPPAAAPSSAPATAQPQAAQSQAAPRPASSGRAERRRRSYAACNRASHQRGLRGGRRRRFLIRCRLGYERTHGQSAQPGAAQPVQPGRKP
ncbi:hypothetical protein MKL09_25370 [Methylobacterium sp. J-048]|uniref:hypothetical protein n=1 Tax=Methylobacterium sp. J-048 TaxID=2836635 RepID=UPI001FBA035B|nr:hypothetical protein [Methylobacterium sp. J-048]MCJ2059848.1 hypothetical protein [Methylobacterium sp. J-048]